MIDKRILLGLCVAAIAVGIYFYGKRQYDAGYDSGYNVAYGRGYSDGYADKGKLPDVRTETKVVYQKVPYTGTDVQVRTEKPVVTVSVNGKKQEVQQHSETADLAVKTETSLNLKIPERRWKFGIGTDGKRPAYMLSAPVKNAVGVWVAGTKEKVMGGVSLSF